uniref:Uncharacterized protein n=1 Tax=Timema shepardi TaxID=629360 RepID=A0A7R9B151_TIMSH|nr:unnamed protein product [Timema shepardi]
MPTSLSARDLRRRSREHRDSFLVDDVSTAASEDRPSCWSWVALAAAFLVQLVVPSILPAYGVLLIPLIEDHTISLFNSIWIPVIYISVWTFSEQLCRKAVDGRRNGKYIALTGVLVSAGGWATGAYFQKAPLRVLGWGIMGGLGTSLVTAQTEATLECHFPSRNGLVQGVQNLGAALGQFAMPLVMYGFLTLYGPKGAPLMQAGVVLHAALGAVLLVPPRAVKVEARWVGRPRSVSVIRETEELEIDEVINQLYDEGFTTAVKFVNDITELSRARDQGEVTGYVVELSRTPSNTSPTCSHHQPGFATLRIFDVRISDALLVGSDSPLLSLTGKSWKNPSMDDPDCDHFEENFFKPTGSPTSVCRRKNAFGVDILPEIPEEGEEDENSLGANETRTPLATNSLERTTGGLKARCVNEIVVGRRANGYKKRKFLRPVPKNKDNEVEQFWRVFVVNGDVAFDDENYIRRNDSFGSSVFDNNLTHTDITEVETEYHDLVQNTSANLSPCPSPISGSPLFSTKLPSSAKITVEDLSNLGEDSRKNSEVIGDGCRKLCRCCGPCSNCRNVLKNMTLACGWLMKSWSSSLKEAWRTPDVLSCLLLRVSIKLCPMGFVVLAPIAVRTHISESSVDEAVYTVTISGFSWLCFMALMPWFVGMDPRRRKYLYSTGCFIASAGLYRQGASLATGFKVIQESLGIWNVPIIAGILDESAWATRVALRAVSHFSRYFRLYRGSRG